MNQESQNIEYKESWRDVVVTPNGNLRIQSTGNVVITRGRHWAWFGYLDGYETFAISRSSMTLTLEQECDFNYVLLQDTIIAANELGFAFCDKDVWFSPVENVRSEQASHPRLILENGMLYIVQDDKRYSILGSHIE